MKTIKSFRNTALAAAALLALTASNSQGALLCYEPFTNGTSGDITTLTPSTGSGFSADWVLGASGASGTSFQCVPGGGNFANGWPNNVSFAAPSGEAQSGQSWDWGSANRTLSAPLNLSAAGTYYLSYLFNDTANNYDMSVFISSTANNEAIYMGPGYGTAVVHAGGPLTTAPFNGLPANVGAPSSWEGTSGTSLVFVVAQITSDGAGNVTVKMKHYAYDPVAHTGGLVDLTPGSVAWEATYTGAMGVAYDQLGVSAAGPQGEALTEIRLGTNWTEVTGAQNITAITTQPQPASATVYVGNGFDYSVTAVGDALTYQWYKDAAPVSGATNASYAATAANGVTDSYSVVVTGTAGSVTSSVVTLTGTALPTISAPFAINFCQDNLGAAYQGQGAYTDPLTSTPTWNLFPGGGSYSGVAVDSTGNPTLTTFFISPYAYYGWYSGATRAITDPYYLLGGFAHSSALTYSFNNVAPGVYSLYLVAQGGDGSWRGGSFSLAAANGGSADGGVTVAFNAGQAPNSFIKGQNYVRFNGVVPDANGNITITETAPPQNAGEADFNGAQLVWTAAAITKPLITTQPQPASQTLYAGYQAAPYSVAAIGPVGDPLSYQWYQGSSPVTGATNANYTATAIVGANNYSVVISDIYGSVTSSIVTLTGVAAPSTAHSSGVAVNFSADAVGLGAYAGQGAYTDPSSTPFWNTFPAGGMASGLANDSSNNPTLTTFTLSAYSYYSWFGGGGPPVATDPDYMLGGFAHGVTLTYSYNNVPPGIYNLYIYAQGGYGSWRGGTFSLGAGNGGGAHNGISSAQNNGTDPDAFIEGQNYVQFTNVMPDAFGNITINQTAPPLTAGEADFNGIQLVQGGVPILNWSHTGSGLILNWSVGTLLQADNVTGPWTTATGVTAGVPIPTTAPKRFYRLQY